MKLGYQGADPFENLPDTIAKRVTIKTKFATTVDRGIIMIVGVKRD